MFAYRREYFKTLFGLFLLVGSLAAVGCGDDSGPAQSPPAATGSEQGAGDAPPQPAVADADADDLEVITAWIGRLSEGDVEGAAELFALPSVAENGSLVTRIETREQALAFNDSLPCGAEVTAAETTGDFTTATFRLTERPGGGCGPGVGGTAATSFVIEDGKIAEWRRVGTDSDPGSSGQSTA
jgi:hypothetical protein